MGIPPLSQLMTGATGLVITQTLRSLATSDACIERIAKEMLARETGRRADEAWDTLNPAQRSVWRQRASSSLIGLLNFAMKK